MVGDWKRASFPSGAIVIGAEQILLIFNRVFLCFSVSANVCTGVWLLIILL